MARYDFRTPRLHVSDDLGDGGGISLSAQQSNYLLNVLRLKTGSSILLFNGRDGEWRGEIQDGRKKTCRIVVCEKLRSQSSPHDLYYLFALLKQARQDYMVQKAVEMGVGRLCPMITQHTQVSRVNIERMRANAIEAAEQCGILSVPDIVGPEKLTNLLDRWVDVEPVRRIIFCDEATETQNPIEKLKNIEPGPLALLIGPEGGFSDHERDLLRSLACVHPIPLGPRILRADTAAVAALAVIQATIGDWH